MVFVVQVIAAYMYFLWTWRDFGYEQHFGEMKTSERVRIMRQSGFNETHYHQLLQEQRRWQRFAQSLARHV
jgi:hypothetical protein